MPRSLLAAVIVAALFVVGLPVAGVGAEQVPLDTLQQIYARLKQCWRAPLLPRDDPGMQITVMVSFKRNGDILGRPRITFETEDASADDMLAYRVAVMKTLQRCTPLPFTEGLGGAVAGRPMTLRFDDRRNLLKPKEKQAWLTPKTP